MTRLAQLAGTGRSHLTQVLSNQPGRGHLTRRRVFPFLTRSEVRLLGWEREYRQWQTNGGRKLFSKNITPLPWKVHYERLPVILGEGLRRVGNYIVFDDPAAGPVGTMFPVEHGGDR